MAVGDKRPLKRTTNPGVRVVGGRIYDSSNGKTCHQCRQKTMDFVASCKSMSKNKQCTINFCHKCLSNRYGEDAEEVETSDDWICPKCRGICNCSFCRKKRGQSPTGILTHRAKASGLSSVSELLQVEGSDNFAYQRKTKQEDVSNIDSVAKTDVELVDAAEDKNKVAGKIKKAKDTRKLKEEIKNAKDANKTKEEIKKAKNASITKEEIKKVKDTNNLKEEIKKAKATKELKEEIKKAKAINKLKEEIKKAKATKELKEEIKKAKAINKLKEETQIDAQLPQGISLTNVSGIDIPAEDTGNVLQFLEFCSVFGKALDLKEGQAESVVAELYSSGRNTKRQQYCTIIPMMIQLLEFISNDREMPLSLSATDSTWFTYLGECILQSGVLGDVFPPETFESGVSEFKKMDASTRLKLLIFLCDESLSTGAMRKFIEDENTESKKRKREANQKAAAAKEKEKQLRQKMQGDLVKAHMEKNGAPLSIEEHHAIMSQIKAEAKVAHGVLLEAKEKQRCDAVRTESILMNDDGLVLWKLKCFQEEPMFLLQDPGTFDGLSPDDKWLAFKPEQKQEIEKYISANRMKLMRAQKNANVEIN
ncbi:unnamed protein product [Thlaspi arvense]|uniref:DDT domain-containing protein n=1 Tax=Thlaspi arvense TaxID=13288 RepID=A0AAU9SLQ3_THLAR|nr:unnamed protein product [Thlaspi arvense]